MSASVYVMRSADGTVLYVGCTTRGIDRISEHRRFKPWWSQVSTVEVRHLASREEGLAAEAAAIVDLQPLYNVLHISRPRPCEHRGLSPVAVYPSDLATDASIRALWGRTLDYHMDQAGVSRSMLVERLKTIGIGVSVTSVGQWVTGKYSPRVDVKAAICHVLGVSGEALWPLDTSTTEGVPT